MRWPILLIPVKKKVEGEFGGLDRPLMFKPNVGWRKRKRVRGTKFCYSFIPLHGWRKRKEVRGGKFCYSFISLHGPC